MTDWATFAGFVGVVLGILLLLARASQRLFDDGSDASAPSFDASDDSPVYGPFEDERAYRRRGPPVPGGGLSADAPVAYGPRREGELDAPSTVSLLANVAITQGVFAVLVVFAVWYTGVPTGTLGLAPGATGPAALGLGVALGVGLYAANEVGSTVGERFGLGGSEELREALAPESLGGWVVLLGVVLPVIAGFEELLFRGVLVGALAAGFGLSPWVLAALSSVAFALGHGAQGPVGVVVTGVLGFVLAAAFVLTNSLLCVVVAHYLVNSLEFLVHEGLDVEWTPGRA